jgi:hypothetical protein
MSSVVRTTTGMTSSASANAPAQPEKCPTLATYTEYTNRPMTIEGAESSTSLRKRVAAASQLPRPYSAT